MHCVRRLCNFCGCATFRYACHAISANARTDHDLEAAVLSTVVNFSGARQHDTKPIHCKFPMENSVPRKCDIFFVKHWDIGQSWTDIRPLFNAAAVQPSVRGAWALPPCRRRDHTPDAAANNRSQIFIRVTYAHTRIHGGT